MPRLLYKPNPKIYNAHVLASAIRIVKRRTELSQDRIGHFLGMGHSTLHAINHGRRNVKDVQFVWYMTALEDLQQKYLRPAENSQVPS
jgi:hypothetical protein